MEEIYADHCPWKDVTERARLVGQLYTHYMNGFLWNDLVEQPDWYLDAMVKAHSAMNKLKRVQAEKHAKKADQKKQAQGMLRKH